VVRARPHPARRRQRGALIRERLAGLGPANPDAGAERQRSRERVQRGARHGRGRTGAGRAPGARASLARRGAEPERKRAATRLNFEGGLHMTVKRDPHHARIAAG